MSMQYCDSCDVTVDTDFDAEHFDEDGVCEFEDLRTILAEAADGSR